MTLVVDASVAFKWLADEEWTPQALALLAGSTPLIAPQHLIAEVCNVAWKSWLRAELSEEQARAAGRKVELLVDTLFPIPDLAESATRMAIELRHPAYDCFYLALAERERSVVVTADGRLVGKVKNTPYATLARHLSDYPSS